MVRNLILSVLTGLVGAALLHIIIVLALPGWAGRDAFSRVVDLGETGQFYSLANEENPTGLANEDPHIRSAVCRFDLSENPVRVTARTPVPLWTLAVFDTASDEVYSMTDRSAIGNGVDITLVTPAQMLQLRRNMPPALTQSVLVELPDVEGFVVLRAITPEASGERAARSFLAEANCLPLVFG